jgi:phage gp29-like protein
MEQLKLFNEPKTVDLKSYPKAPYRSASLSDLSTRKIEPLSPRSEYRNMFGASLSMDRINNAILSAYRGEMDQLTDLSRETIDTDPHLASVLQKRFANVSTLPWAVIPASGHGVDKDKANFYADIVREQIQNLQNFRQILRQNAWALFDGRCASENIWIPIANGQRIEGGKRVWIALDKINWIHPRLLNFNDRRDLVISDGSYGYFYWGRNDGITLNEDTLKAHGLWGKFNWWMPQLFGEYPEREGLAIRCLYWSFFKRFAARDRLILLELFGKPLRYLEVDEDSTASEEDLEAARTNADAMGSYFSAQMPRGVHMKFFSPGELAGQNYENAIQTSNSELSKLVLGQIGTTDGVKAGLNSSTAIVMQKYGIHGTEIRCRVIV